MPKNRKLQNVIGTEHIKDAAEAEIAAQASGGATLAFKNVAVSGQDNIVADGATDTLNIAGAGSVSVTTNASNDTLTITGTDTNTQLSTEQVQDIVGAMFTGNTETNITATYEDSDGTIDLVASGGGGGGLPIHHVDEDNPPTFSNGAAYGTSSLGFSATPGIPQTSSIGGGNFTTSSIHLWAFTWPNDDHYIDSIKMRVFSASNAGVESSCQLAFYKADANGWFGARTGSNVTITPTSTGAHFLTTTLAGGSGIGPFNRGDLIWAGFAGPAATQRGQTVGTIRFYGQGSNIYPVAGMGQSTAGPNPGYSYLFPYRLNVNSGGLNALPSDLRDASTWSIPDGSPSTHTIIPSTFTLSSTFYFPYIQIHMRDTA